MSLASTLLQNSKKRELAQTEERKTLISGEEEWDLAQRKEEPCIKECLYTLFCGPIISN
jgi:hypothetical protein